MGKHKTWEKPDKAEARQLNLAMAWKAVRLLLSSAAIYAYVQFVIWIRHCGIPMNYTVFHTIIASLFIVAFYCFFINALVFGRRHSLDDEIKDTTLSVFSWTIVNALILVPLFLFFADKMRIVSIILIALMSVMTFWKEWFMLILFVMKKYTVKDGDVFYHKRERGVYFSETRKFSWTSLVYILSFEDACRRDIPVMVDLYTYLCFKKNGDALLINYKYGESYLFELVKYKKKAGDSTGQDEVIEYESETPACNEPEKTPHENFVLQTPIPKYPSEVKITNLTRKVATKEGPNMAIDKAEWQYDSAQQYYCEQTGKKPEELTEQDAEIIWDYAGNHIAFFITWLLRHDLLGDIHNEDDIESEDIEAVKNQEKTGMDIFRKYCDMAFTDEDVSDLVMDFVNEYYDKQYLKDYGEYMRDKVLSTGFSWDDYLGFEPVIDRAFDKFH